MIRIRTFFPGIASLLLVGGVVSCAGSSGGKKPSGAQTQGAKVWQPAQPGPENPAVAKVNGRYITRHDVDSVLATAPQGIRDDYQKNPEQYQQLVERIANQEAMYRAALKAGIDKDPSYLSELRSEERQLLLRHYYQNALGALPAIPDSAVKRYYDEHPSEFKVPGHVRVRHIQVATRAKAKEVLRRLGAETWDRVAARYSTDKTTAENGGMLGYITNDTPVVTGLGTAPAIVAAAFQLKEGETSEPLKSPKGWHVIRVDEKTESGPQKFEAVKRQIRSNLESQRTEHFQEDLVNSLKREYGVVVFTDSLQAAMSPKLGAADLFARAQNTENPGERIELFRQIVRRYPQDKSATQAAFMIGFTYAEELKDFPAAREAFQSFLTKYPQSDLVASAKWMMENMEHGVPPPSVGIPDTLQIHVTPGTAPGGSSSRP